MRGRLSPCCASGSVRLKSCSGGTRWYSFGVLSIGVLSVIEVLSVKALSGAALRGVGKTFAGLVKADKAENLLSGLWTEALGKVDAVGRSSSV